MEPILHHFKLSPFSEPIRGVFGVKKLLWHSVLIEVSPPRPNQLPLTGGYRRTPILQFGADIYCDTQIIFKTLEDRYPQPSIFPSNWSLLHNTLKPWVAEFSIEVIKLRQALFGHKLGPQEFQEFLDNRRIMGVDNFDLGSVMNETEHLRENLDSYSAWVENQLNSNNPFLLGEDISIIDLRVFQGFNFADVFLPEVIDLFDHYPNLQSWKARIREIGHGDRKVMSRETALAIGSRNKPLDIAEEYDGTHDIKIGDQVTIHADDYGFEETQGKLIKFTSERISVLRNDPIAGEIAVHFPRYGFIAAPTNK